MSAFSVEAWVNLPFSATTEKYVLWRSGQMDLRVKVNGIAFSAKIAGTLYVYRPSSVTLAGDTWHHIVGVYDGADMKVYLNGSLVGTEARTGSVSKAPARRASPRPSATTPQERLIDRGRPDAPPPLSTVTALRFTVGAGQPGRTARARGLAGGCFPLRRTAWPSTTGYAGTAKVCYSGQTVTDQNIMLAAGLPG